MPKQPKKPATSTKSKHPAPAKAPTKRKAPAKHPKAAAPVGTAPLPAKAIYVPVADIPAKPSAAISANPAFDILTWPFRWFWRVKWGLLYLVIFLGSLLLVPSESARLSTQDDRYDANAVQLASVPQRDVALVFGAGVLPDHTPTDYLKQRVSTAVDLYKAGRVGGIIMSGDNSSTHHNEPKVMKDYAVKLGVPADHIVMDPAGLSTYDSCYRAQKVFKVSSATIVTQGYHLPRAVMTCRKQGIDAIGVASKRNGRDWTVRNVVREQIATAKALVQSVLKPQPSIVTTAIPAQQ